MGGKARWFVREAVQFFFWPNMLLHRRSTCVESATGEDAAQTKPGHGVFGVNPFSVRETDTFR